MFASKFLITTTMVATIAGLPLSSVHTAYAGADIKSQWDRFSSTGNKESTQPKQETTLQKPVEKKANQQPSSNEPQQTNSATQAQDPNKVQVEAEGIGATKLDALTAAWNEAVQKGVGLFMTSKTEVIDDKLTEKIVTHSRGQVNNYKELSAEKKEDGWHVRISAQIDKDILQETAQAITKQEVEFDGSNIAAKMETGKNKSETQKEALEMLKDLSDWKDCLNYSFRIIHDTNEKKIFGEHSLDIDIEKYITKSKQICNFLDKICTSKQEVNLDSLERNKDMLNILKSKSWDKGFVVGRHGLLYNSGYHINHFNGNFPSNSITVITSTSKGISYIFEKEINLYSYFRDNLYECEFSVESTDGGFDSTLAHSSTTLYIVSEKMPEIKPLIYHYNNPQGTFSSTRFKFMQELKLTKDDLVNKKKYIGKYLLKK